MQMATSHVLNYSCLFEGFIKMMQFFAWILYSVGRCGIIDHHINILLKFKKVSDSQVQVLRTPNNAFTSHKHS